MRPDLVNIMTMDFGNGYPTNGDMGQYAIEALQATHSQLMKLYPDLTSKEVWSMLGATPLIGVNDGSDGTFTLTDARQLENFAQQQGLGELSMWAIQRDEPGPLGIADGNFSSGVAQTPFEFSKIFEGDTLSGADGTGTGSGNGAETNG